MGRILQIRLSATTPCPPELFRAWPQLCQLAWEKYGSLVDKVWVPHSSESSIFPTSSGSFGVIELSQTLAAELRFGNWPQETRTRIAERIALLEQYTRELEIALGNWDAAKAHQASSQMEECLDDMEALLA